MRMNALAPLADSSTLLADLRAASIGSNRGGLRVRDVELALNKSQPEADESVPSADGVVQAFSNAEAQDPGLLQRVRQAHEAVSQLDALLTDKVGTAGPELKPLKALTQWLAESAAQAAGESMDSPTDGGQGAAGPRGAPGTIQTREDAIRALNLVCDWIERHEPSNPAPLLIRRAERLMSKNFMEIIRDLVPDGLGQVEKIAGIEPQ
jgi:type VI secretion system protein ImpA